ncbi:Integrin beta, variant 4 [Balamuthia mandrillaris]
MVGFNIASFSDVLFTVPLPTHDTRHTKNRDDPTNWVEEDTGAARVPTKDDDVILGGSVDYFYFSVYTVTVQRLGRPVEVNSLTLEACEKCQNTQLGSYMLWNGTEYLVRNSSAGSGGYLCGVSLDIVAPTTLVVRGAVSVGKNSVLRLCGAEQDPWLAPTIQLNGGTLTIERAAKLTGNGAIHGNVRAKKLSEIFPLVWWQGQPYPSEGGLGGTLHFYGNLSLEWPILHVFASGFEKSNFSQFVIHEELHMMPRDDLGGTSLRVHLSDALSVLVGSAEDQVLRSPSFILFENMSGDNGTTRVEANNFNLKRVQVEFEPILFVRNCPAFPSGYAEEPSNCQERTSRHDLSFLLSGSSIHDNECPAYSCPGVPQCSGRGRCEDGGCVCNSGWADLDCSAEDCPGSPDCNGHGYCLVDSADDTPKCQCLEGWSGEACETPECPNDCTDDAHGYCDSSSIIPKCVCSVGYVLGPLEDCSVRSLRCPGLGKECSGFGTCNNQTGNCSCLPGRTGADCSIPVCEGRPNQCSHHGLCLWDEQSNTAVCDCDEGWGGEDCSLPQCPSSCSGHGVCMIDLDPPRCLCDGPEELLPFLMDPPPYQGWTGDQCQQLVTNCNSDESRCGSRCGTTDAESYGCRMDECPDGWRGWDCSTPVCINTGNPECHGHGRCVAQDTNSPPQCECREGWLPPDCRLAACSVDEGKKECSGRGKCMVLLSPPRCHCDPFAYGPLCEQYEPPCAGGEQECSSHGQCINGTCHCDEDWRGLDCSIIDHQGECANNCSSNGVCKPSSSSEGENLLPVCHCFEGWFGTDCSRSSSETGEKEADFMEEHPWAVPLIVVMIIVLLIAATAAVGGVVFYRQRVALRSTVSASRHSINF